MAINGLHSYISHAREEQRSLAGAQRQAVRVAASGYVHIHVYNLTYAIRRRVPRLNTCTHR